MRTKIKVTSKKRSRTSAKKAAGRGASPAVKTKCNHCGGLLKHIPGEESCIICGRSADHHCPACLYDNEEVAA